MQNLILDIFNISDISKYGMKHLIKICNKNMHVEIVEWLQKENADALLL